MSGRRVILSLCSVPTLLFIFVALYLSYRRAVAERYVPWPDSTDPAPVKITDRCLLMDTTVSADLDGDSFKDMVRICSLRYIKYPWPSWFHFMSFGHDLAATRVTVQKNGQTVKELFFQSKPTGSRFFDSARVLDLNADGTEEIILDDSAAILVIYQQTSPLMSRLLPCRRAHFDRAPGRPDHDIVCADGARYRWFPSLGSADPFLRIN